MLCPNPEWDETPGSAGTHAEAQLPFVDKYLRLQMKCRRDGPISGFAQKSKIPPRRTK